MPRVEGEGEGLQLWEGQGRVILALVLALLQQGWSRERLVGALRPMKEATEADKPAPRALWVGVLPREQWGAQKSSRTAGRQGRVCM